MLTVDSIYLRPNLFLLFLHVYGSHSSHGTCDANLLGNYCYCANSYKVVDNRVVRLNNKKVNKMDLTSPDPGEKGFSPSWKNYKFPHVKFFEEHCHIPTNLLNKLFRVAPM